MEIFIISCYITRIHILIENRLDIRYLNFNYRQEEKSDSDKIIIGYRGVGITLLSLLFYIF